MSSHKAKDTGENERETPAFGADQTRSLGTINEQKADLSKKVEKNDNSVKFWKRLKHASAVLTPRHPTPSYLESVVSADNSGSASAKSSTNGLSVKDGQNFVEKIKNTGTNSVKALESKLSDVNPAHLLRDKKVLKRLLQLSRLTATSQASILEDEEQIKNMMGKIESDDIEYDYVYPDDEDDLPIYPPLPFDKNESVEALNDSHCDSKITKRNWLKFSPKKAYTYLSYMMETTKMNNLWELFDLILNLAIVSMHVINSGYSGKVLDGRDLSDDFLETQLFAQSTSLDPQLSFQHHTDHLNLEASSSGNATLPSNFKQIDFIFSALLLLQFIPRYVLTNGLNSSSMGSESSGNNNTLGIISHGLLMMFLTLVCTIPILSAYWCDFFYVNDLLKCLGCIKDFPGTFMDAGWLVYLFPFKFVRLHMALMASLVPSKTSILDISLITRKSIRLIAFLLFLVLTTASFVHVVAIKAQGVRNLTFFDSFFFAIVSATSGTTRQIVPDSAFSRLVILYIMFSGAIFIPTRLSELLSLISKKSRYDHSYKVPKYGFIGLNYFSSAFSAVGDLMKKLYLKIFNFVGSKLGFISRGYIPLFNYECDDQLDISKVHKKSQNVLVDHVVVSGSFDPPYTSLHTFFSELFSPDHVSKYNPVRLHAVILNPNEPSEEFKDMILDDRVWGSRVRYVKGSVMDVKSLEKVKAREAKACFVFSRQWVGGINSYSKFSNFEDTKFENLPEDTGKAAASRQLQAMREEDARVVMRALAIRKWCGTDQNNQNQVKIHVQVLLPENKVHFDYLADSMVCVNELKLGILAQNCRCPGFSTLIHNLTTSITYDHAKRILNNSMKKYRTHPSISQAVSEYLKGANQEVYVASLPVAFKGFPFWKVSNQIFKNFNAALFGLGIPNDSYKRKLKKRRNIKHWFNSVYFNGVGGHTLSRSAIPNSLDDPTIDQQNVLNIFLQKMRQTDFDAQDFDLYLNPGEYVLRGREIGFFIAEDGDTINHFPVFSDEEVEKLMLSNTIHSDSSKENSSQEKSTHTGVGMIWQKLRSSMKGKIISSSSSDKNEDNSAHSSSSDLNASASTKSISSFTQNSENGSFSYVKDLIESSRNRPPQSGPQDENGGAFSGTAGDGSLMIKNNGDGSTAIKDILPTDLFAEVHGDIEDEVRVSEHAVGNPNNSKELLDPDQLNELAKKVAEAQKISGGGTNLQAVAKILNTALMIPGGLVNLTTKYTGINEILNQSTSVISKAMNADQKSSGQTNEEKDRCIHSLPEYVSNHIIICDASPRFPRHLEYFIAPLRSSHLKISQTDADGKPLIDQWTPIVILSPAPPSLHQKKMLMKFEDVFVVNGDPMARKDLYRAGVERCLKAVVLANSAKALNEPERTADASSLLTVLNIEAMSKEDDLYIVTEFIHFENTMFIGESDVRIPGKTTRDIVSRIITRPAFMAGHVYCATMLDTIMCQNYYNPHLFHILRHMIFSGTFHTENQVNVAASEVEGDPKKKPALHSHIWLIKIPQCLEGILYEDFFNFLAQEYHAIPIGMYRRTDMVSQSSSRFSGSDIDDSNDHSVMGFRQRNERTSRKGFHLGDSSMDADSMGFVPHHYVCCNPAPKTKIKDNDWIYVLSVEKPKI